MAAFDEMRFQKIERELKNTRYTLGALITWLHRELGSENATKLLDMLSKETKDE